jgi:hypothetical protein
LKPKELPARTGAVDISDPTTKQLAYRPLAYQEKQDFETQEKQ